MGGRVRWADQLCLPHPAPAPPPKALRSSFSGLRGCREHSLGSGGLDPLPPSQLHERVPVGWPSSPFRTPATSQYSSSSVCLLWIQDPFLSTPPPQKKSWKPGKPRKQTEARGGGQQPLSLSAWRPARVDGASAWVLYLQADSGLS